MCIIDFYLRRNSENMKRTFTIFVLVFLIASLSNYANAQTSDKVVILETQSGKIIIEFFPDDAPNHVANFIELTESGFYDETVFHRIITGFMIQGGDPNTISGDPSTWGTGGSVGNVDAEFNKIKHDRGIVSMARSADPNSASSQFFIVHENSYFLDEEYTVFGRILTQESFDTLDKIASLSTAAGNVPLDIEQAKILKAQVVIRSEISDLLNLGSPEVESTMEEKMMEEPMEEVLSPTESITELNADATAELTTESEEISDKVNQEGGGCLIATATFGSELAPQVQQLRELRDNSLLQTESGSAFMESFNQFYYSFSPTIADYERQNPVFKEIVKIGITPLLASLSILNYVDMDSEFEVLGYGISLILLNVGMYFFAPGIVIYRLIRTKK